MRHCREKMRLSITSVDLKIGEAWQVGDLGSLAAVPG
jgi:hypothetical protein